MMYKAHRGMTALDVARNDSEDSAVYTFASRNEDGTQLLINLTNAHMNDGAEVRLHLPCGAQVDSMETLASEDPHDCNTVEHSDLVRTHAVDVDSAVFTVIYPLNQRPLVLRRVARLPRPSFRCLGECLARNDSPAISSNRLSGCRLPLSSRKKEAFFL